MHMCIHIHTSVLLSDAVFDFDECSYKHFGAVALKNPQEYDQKIDQWRGGGVRRKTVAECFMSGML
jgi:hypothetical protein